MKSREFRYTLRFGATGVTLTDAKTGTYDITNADDATLSRVAANICATRGTVAN